MELTVISGKGGTGKTTVAVALAELAKETVTVDCDVDAPNLYLYFKGEDIQAEDFSGGPKAVVDSALCVQCGICQETCQFEAIVNGDINPFRCEGCGACVITCPQKAISLVDEKSAEVYLTEPFASQGPLVRAQMEVGSEGSGKLVTLLRKKAKEQRELGLTVIDGSPGIGCPVIASITAANAVLIVTEPTQSGLEDLKRIVVLCQQFRLRTFVCINKADLNSVMSRVIKQYCEEQGLTLIGKIPFDEVVLRSINELKPIIHYENSSANKAIREMWAKLSPQLSPNK